MQSICAVLQTYIQKCNNTLPLQEDAPLFVSLRNRRLSHCNVNQTFCYLLKKCRIHKSKDNGPRIHDFRHTFAVHRLLKWYDDGQDINNRLPALATYMGHVGIGSTQIYLQATPELLERANQRFLKYFNQHIINNGGLS